MQPRSSGFTLLELAIVLVVFGVVFSLAAAVLPRRAEVQIEQEAVRLARVLDALQREALLQARPTGLRITGQGYETLQLNLENMVWEVNASRLLAPHGLGALGLALAPVAVVEQPLGVDEWPEVVFDAAGVSEPIALQLLFAGGGVAARVGSDGINRARLQ